MRIILSLLAGGAAMLGGPALAQSSVPQANTIVVAASAQVESPPDSAILSITVHGNGKVPDEATRLLAAKLKAITDGLHSIDPATEIRTGSVAIGEVYAGECNRDSGLPLSPETQVDMAAASLSAEADRLAGAGDAAPPKMVSDPCQVIGYVARSDATVKMAKVSDAGTAVGLAGRLGASRAGIESFQLAKDDDARTRATAAAIANARRQAEAIAAGSGVKLGSIVSVVDGQGDDIAARQAQSAGMVLNSMSVAAPPPVTVDISPGPQLTFSRLIVTFAVIR